MKVRFAPSPTGFLHIGGARTALFNWMYARSQNGTFVLRIEDTDQQRSKKEFENEILDSMKWLGFDWDEIGYQSQRFEVYREYANKLLSEGKAYKDGEAIILTMPQKEIKLYDLIRGEIVFDTATLKDQVLMKSDGSPAYSFACVVDDALMEITCVIRGEDHISNTPKQMIIYEALGFKVPKFAHLPLIMGEEGRLSKRTGAVAVSDYRKAGFLSEAIVNYLMLLGWSPGNNQEVMSLAAAVKKFSIKKINKAAAVFDLEKLKWINGQYIKQKSEEELADLILPFLKEKSWEVKDREQLKAVLRLYKSRLATLIDFFDWASFVFGPEIVFDPEVKEKHLAEDKQKEFSLLAERLMSVEEYNAHNLEKEFQIFLNDLSLSAGALVHPIRVALTGKAVGPSLFEIMEVLGKEKTLERLNSAFSLRL